MKTKPPQTEKVPAVAQPPLVRHCCYECGKGRGIAYTAQPWSGPCYICRRPIFCDRILTDKCLTCGDTGKVWNAPDEREEDYKNCLPNVKSAATGSERNDHE